MTVGVRSRQDRRLLSPLDPRPVLVWIARAASRRQSERCHPVTSRSHPADHTPSPELPSPNPVRPPRAPTDPPSGAPTPVTSPLQPAHQTNVGELSSHKRPVTV